MIRSPVAVRFDSVFFSYGEISVLKNVDFHIHEGEFAALLGPNGSGKTTMLKLLLGLERPTAGRVSVFGLPADQGRMQIGYVPQAVVYDPAFPITVAEVVRMGRLRGRVGRYSRSDHKIALKAMNEAEVADLAQRSYTALSGGQRRRVLVARALAAEPRLLVLDEPTSNMDAESEELLYKSLSLLKDKTTILMVTHDTAFVSSLTDAVFCLGEGTEEKGAVLHHPATPAKENIPPFCFGGSALRVVHDEELPDDGCFEKGGNK